jgi:methyl-accepting chemotaxis protein
MVTQSNSDAPISKVAALFRPAIALLNRLRYSYKFAAIGVVLIIPFAFLLSLQYTASGDSKKFSEKESQGIEYIRPVREMLFALQRRRVLAVAGASGEASLASQVQGVTEEINEKVKEIDAVDAKLGVELKASEKWKTLKAEWLALKSFTSTDPAATDDAHAKVTGVAIDLILNDVGNASNLILDPDLDSYWLMDAYVVKMPAIADSTAKLAALGQFGGKADNSVVLSIGGTSQVLRALIGDLNAVNMKTAIKESSNPAFGQSPTLKSNLEAPASTLIGTGESLTEVVTGDIANEKRGAKAIADSALKLLAEANAFHTKLEPELDWLCKKRAAGYAAKQLQGLVVGLGAVLLLAYIFVSFFYAIRGSVVALGEAAARMIAGNEEPVRSENRDEIADIVGSFNAINGALIESRRLQRSVQSDNQLLQDNIMDMLRVVSDASDGDLRVRAKITEGALGNVADAFNQLLESLESLIGDIKKQLSQTLRTVADISSASSGMAVGAGQQAEEVVAATLMVQKMISEIQRVSDSAQVATATAKKTELSALRGTEGVKEAISGMTSLRGNVQAGAKKMKSLGDRSMEITSIVNTINRISEQTDMLALNAAIEAARAGEHGRGFTVVAEEVRKLAERTATATQEIDKLVKTIHSETAETVLAIEQQTQFVEREAAVVGKTGEFLDEIRSVSTESATLVANISVVALEQVKDSERVVNTMREISNIAQSTRSTAEGTSTIVSELRTLSEALGNSLERFKLSA